MHEGMKRFHRMEHLRSVAQLYDEQGTPARLRTFPTGATRDTDHGKLDYDGFLSPLTLRRYAEYMHQHRTQSDGSLRASDNWQKGIPQSEYRKSLWRHAMDWWLLLRGWPLPGANREDLACAILFNISGWLHEELKARGYPGGQ